MLGGQREERFQAPMSRRAHFVTSAIPLNEGGDYLALCGNVILSSKFLYQIDLGDNHPMPTMAMCGKCATHLMLGKFAEAVHYIYAVVGR